MELTFEIDIPGEERCVKSITRPMIRVGIDSVRCQIALPGEVGRSHALIEGLNHDLVTLSDLGMFAGTKVNGKKIHNDKCNLKLGDVICIGHSKVTLIGTKVGEDARVYTAPVNVPTQIQNESLADGTEVPVTAFALPEWFRATPGFRFVDGDGDVVIFLGSGNFCDVKCIGAINLKGSRPQAIYESSIVEAKMIATTMSNHWYMWDLSLEDEAYWAASKPL